MANAVRPPLRSSNERQTKLNFLPVSRDDAHAHAHAHTHHAHAQRTTNPPTIATRRSSRSDPLLALADDEKPVKHITNTRKRPATALEPDDATDTRPPTKVTVTHPHGHLLRITNGVTAPLAPEAEHAQDKRSLRSHDGGSRLKSDLAIYFANYDDVIAGVSKHTELLELDAPIYIVDEPFKSKTPAPVPSETTSPAQSSISYHVLNYATVASALGACEDPLADALYFTQHRRAERKEKQLRNIEKERAMHEKVQLERLLDGLQGPDWLKVMGITGVTDGERRDWENKRDYFVSEVEALVDKFRVWKEEEKRLRAEKEAALAAREEDEEEEEDGEETEGSDTITVHSRHHPPPPPRQLPKETEPPKPRRPPRPHGFLLPLVPPEPAAPFQSFYSKPHLRAAALGKHRHGRNSSAFGQPVPDFEDKEFSLPSDFIDPQFLRDNARQRRRRKRESGVTATPAEQQQQQ